MTARDVLRARARFWTHVAPPNENGCRLWLASTYVSSKRNSGPYPQFVLRSGINVRGHRFAWVAAGRTTDEIRERIRRIRGKCVRHLRCDVTMCVEPKHLRPGSCQDNSNDAKRRGRVPRGTRHYLAKMTPQKIVLMRKMRDDGVSFVELGKAFGLHPSNISRIFRGLTYAGGM